MASSTVSFSGLASGIDSASLIEATIAQQRKARVTPIENKISSYNETKDALSKLKTLLNDLKSASESFRMINGGSLSKTVQSSDETILQATASNSANIGNYEITVSSLAKTGTFSFAERFSSYGSLLASGLVGTKNIDVTVGNETISVEVDSTTTLESFVTKYNALSKNGEASVINVGTTSNPSYALMITSSETGTEKGAISINVADEIIAANEKLDPTKGSLSQAQNLKLSIAGVAENIERTSNTISDLLPGVTFKANSTGTVNIQTDIDSDTTLDKVQNFVDAFNKVVEYIREQDEITSEKDGDNLNVIYGALSSTTLDENILSTLRSAISQARSTSGGVRIFSELGITTKQDGTLAFDEETFKSALARDSKGVSELLTNVGEDLGAVNGKIFQFVGYNMLIDQSVSNLDTQISNSNDKIATLESYLSKYEERLNKKYANLEVLMSKLQAQQNTLTGVLASLQ